MARTDSRQNRNSSFARRSLGITDVVAGAAGILTRCHHKSYFARRYRNNHRVQQQSSDSDRLDPQGTRLSTSAPVDFIICGTQTATAYKLGRRHPGLQITVLEKEDSVGRHQSSHNSGVLHCGLYYQPGSIRARLAVSGIQEMIAFCRVNNIPHEVCGKLVVAVDESELPRLHALQECGHQNGLRGLRFLKREQMREIEPHAGGAAALHVPQEGIVDYARVCAVLQEKVAAQGGKVVTRANVTALRPTAGGWIAWTTAGEVEADFLVNCAGLHCDRVSELAGEKREVRIVPFRGEYYKIRPERQFLVRNLIYPVPDPQFPFLGVHFTRMIRGGIEAGPNAVLAFAREGYRKSDV
ncbi:MAG: L-2-hydroxyglutarate oxidase, partial [Verrucomicrobia bacterium]